DVSGLRAFKSALKPGSVPLASCLATWDFSGDPCAAPRITSFTCGITCSDGRVVQLTLDSQGYSGELSPAISELTHLEALDLGENDFHGPIPESISSLSNLRTLILSRNSFSGAISPSIAAIRSLETLDLSRNSLAGRIPPELKSLSGLTRLDLSYNNLSGPLPELPKNLNELALKANSLSGPLSESSFHELSQLMVLELSENSFTGVLGSWIFRLPSLQQIDLASNSFTAVDVGAEPNGQLVAVDLSRNKIEGFLTENFARFTTLRSLSLSCNQFRGPIPSEYGRKGLGLQRLYLDGNYLNGSPPVAFFSGDGTLSGSLGDNCLRRCPTSSELCLKSQKPVKICQLAYGGK
ncbi:hypothetical protein M569_12432, partial [Genlisea aurea]